MEELNDVYNIYEEILINPHILVDGMTYDEFVEWVDIGTIEEIEDAILTFANAQMYQHVDIMKICANKKRHDISDDL